METIITVALSIIAICEIVIAILAGTFVFKNHKSLEKIFKSFMTKNTNKTKSQKKNERNRIEQIVENVLRKNNIIPMTKTENT